ncbi:hypothetical protein ACWGB8_01310 [Kitasatospora sp. NPDC054939]
MAVIAVAGGTGAPGATSTALALLLAWPLQPGRRILLVECDPDGGAVLAGALEGRVEAVYGLRNLAVADRRGLLGQALWEQLIDLSPDGSAERLLLPGLTDPTQAPGLAYTWEPLMEVLHGLEPQGYDVLLDLGRSGATGASAVLARRADVVAATVRTTLRGLSAARPRLAALAEDLASAGAGADSLGLLLVAEGPYSANEVSREFGLPVLGLLPYAPRTARTLSDGGDTADRRFVRSELMRTARSAADEAQLMVRRRRQRLAPTAPPAPAAGQLPPGYRASQEDWTVAPPLRAGQPGAGQVGAGQSGGGPLGAGRAGAGRDGGQQGAPQYAQPQPVAPHPTGPQPMAPPPVVPQPAPPRPMPPQSVAAPTVPQQPVIVTGPVAPAGAWGQASGGPVPAGPVTGGYPSDGRPADGLRPDGVWSGDSQSGQGQAPFAGLAPQPAAPAPFPAPAQPHAQPHVRPHARPSTDQPETGYGEVLRAR